MENVKIMDIVFVNSMNFDKDLKSIPLGLLTLATILDNEGYSVDIIDFDLLIHNGAMSIEYKLDDMIDKMTNILLSLKPKIVSFYTMSNCYPFIIKLSENIKRQNSRIKIIFGGPQASLTAYETLKQVEFLDAIGIGEGERVIIPLVEALLTDKSLNEIKGVAFRQKHDIIINENQKVIEDLDELPYIGFKFLDKFIGQGWDVIDIDVGRGCPYSCRFCCTSIFWKRKYRLKSTERILQEIIRIKEKYNINRFAFQHDLFTMNREKVIDFCKQVTDKGLEIEWRCSSRIDTLDEELVAYMKKAGCSNIYIGIETGSAKMQRVIKKNLTLGNIMKVIRLLNIYKIKATTSFIYGFEEETTDDIRQTLSLINELLLNNVEAVQLHRLTILPATEYYFELKEQLVFEENSINYDVNEGRYIFELKELIKSNQYIFSNFYEFNSSLRKVSLGLNEFISFMLFVYKNFKYAYLVLIKKYDNDLYEVFADNRVLIENMKKDIFHKQYSENDLSKVILKVFYQYIQQIISNIDENKLILENMFKFEKHLFKLRYNYYSANEVTEKFSIDVLKVYKDKMEMDMDLDKISYDITVKYTKLPNNKIGLKAI